MENTLQSKKIDISLEDTIKSIGVRGGNDMISGAENWDDIEVRMDDDRTNLAEEDETVRAVGNGQLDPSDEHALSPNSHPHGDPADDLVRLMSESLHNLETYDKYCSHADAKNETELAGFFREIRQDEKMRLSKARLLLANHFAKVQNSMPTVM